MRKSAKCARFGLLPFSTLIGLKRIITEIPTWWRLTWLPILMLAKPQTSIPFVFRCVLCVMHSTNQVMNHGRVTWVARVAQIPVGIHWLLQCKRRTSAVCALMRGLIPTAIPRHQNSHGLVSHGAMQKMQKHASTYSPMEGSVSLTLPSSGQSTELWTCV